MTEIVQRDGLWYVKGHSEAFNTRVEAIKRAKQLVRNKAKQKDGRRFISEKLQMAFRSNWEIELAELMSELGIEFEYEPERFYFRAEHESYLPDFYLPEYNVWIEVKGYMDKRSLKRVKLFQKYHGAEYGFFLFEKEERDLVVLKGMTEVLLQYIEIAQQEQQRRMKQREEHS